MSPVGRLIVPKSSDIIDDLPAPPIAPKIMLEEMNSDLKLNFIAFSRRNQSGGENFAHISRKLFLELCFIRGLAVRSRQF